MLLMRIDCYLMKLLLLGVKGKHMGTSRTNQEVIKDVHKILDQGGDAHKEEEANSKATSSPTRSFRPVRLQTDVQDEYGLGSTRIIYRWKDNEKTFPMPPVSSPNSTGCVRNSQNKSSLSLYGCCATLKAFGPCIQLGPTMGAS